MNAWIIYLWGVAGKVDAFLGPMLIVTGIIGLVVIIAASAGYTESQADEHQQEICVKIIKRVLIGWFSAFTIFMAAPDQKVLAAMIILPAVIESKVLQEDVPELWGEAVDFLKQSMKKDPAVEVE